MPYPPLLRNALPLATAVALLVSVMISPIRPESTAGGSSRPDCFRRNFGIPSKVTTSHRPHVPVTARVVQIKALSSESDPDWATPPTCHGADLACVLFSPAGPGRHSAAVPVDRSTHPLRC